MRHLLLEKGLWGLVDGTEVLAEGTLMVNAARCGRCPSEFKVSEPKYVVMYQVLRVPKLACNQLSSRAAAAKGKIAKFGQCRWWIRDSSGKLRGMGSLVDQLYRLDCCALPSEQVKLASSKLESEANLWHQRLGHLSGQ